MYIFVHLMSVYLCCSDGAICDNIDAYQAPVYLIYSGCDTRQHDL